jgi:hypothetical protein
MLEIRKEKTVEVCPKCAGDYLSVLATKLVPKVHKSLYPKMI